VKAVLFVDDHEVLARLSREILEMQGYRAVCAYNAADALERFSQEKFDILVTDWKMEGMDGLELARQIHARNPQIPVILVTGYGPVETGDVADACLSKDHLFPALIEKIKLFLGENETVEAEEPAPAQRG
jgi:CheY-like chemotaxis protein